MRRNSSAGGSRPRPLFFGLNLAIGAIVLAGALLLFPPVSPSPHYDYKLGDVTQTGEEVIAPVSFPVPVSPSLLAEQRAAASLAVPPVYRLDPSVARQQSQKLVRLWADLAATEPLDSLETLNQRVDRLLGLQPGLEREAVATLLLSEDPAPLLDAVAQSIDSLLDRGILDSRRPLVQSQQSEARLILVHPGGERSLRASNVVDQDALSRLLEREAAGRDSWAPEVAGAFQSLARAHLRPNYFHDAEETELRKRSAADAVPFQRIIAKGVRILGPNVQVTQDHLERLAALETALGHQSLSPWRRAALFAGRLLILLFLTALMVRFLILYRQDFFLDARHTLLLGLLILFFLGASRMALDLETGGQYLLPITFVAMIVAGLHDERLAMMVTLFAMAILGTVADAPTGGMLVALLAGGAASFSIGQLRSRLQLYRSVFIVGLAYLLGITAVHMGAGEEAGLLRDALKGMGNGLICAWLVMPILPLLERFFDLTTDFTLLELTDLNRPVLKRMKVEAPGTFQHSLAVSNLAEAAADAIGANPLLAKVCAYYHDIGKLAKPDYFAENIAGFKNRHEKLTPNMSALIIGDHVKRGLEMAEKIKLPGIVRKGIPEHHGTTVMHYFYVKAQESNPHAKVTEDEFRYPGPRPQSAETAILMLADMVEATARTLSEPSAGSIRAVVIAAIEKRLQERELEDCGLSISDLALIRDSFITTLLSIYHPRIKYPTERPKPERETESMSETKATTEAAPDVEGKQPAETAEGEDRATQDNIESELR